MLVPRFMLAMVAALTPALAAAQVAPTDPIPSGTMTNAVPSQQTTESAAAVRGSATDVTTIREGGSLDAANMRALAERRRNDAMVLAAKVRSGAAVPEAYAKPLVEAIDGDLKLWREEFQVAGKEYREARKRWLETDKPATANAWALRRADFYAERDRWIATRPVAAK